MRKAGLLFVFIFLFASTAITQDTYRLLKADGFSDVPGGNLTEKDIAWVDLKDMFESQHSFLLARFDQGYWLFTQFFNFKYGPHQRWGVYGIVVDDSGHKWFAKREIQPKDVELSHDKLFWNSNGTSVSGAYPEYDFTINEEAFQAKLAVHCRFPGWKLGKTTITEDKKTMSEVFIHIPWGKISGTLTLDGKTIPVTGQAYGDRFHGNQRLDLADPLFYSVRAISPLPGWPQVSIETTFNRFNPAFGKISTPILTIMGEDGFQRATMNVVINGEEFEMNRELGYYFPKRLIVKSDAPGLALRGVFTVGRSIEVLDVLAQLPPYMRKLAEKFVKLPVMSKWDGIFEGSYTLNGKETKFKIRALSEINYVGGRDAIPRQ